MHVLCFILDLNLFPVLEQTSSVVKEYVPADTREHSGSLSLDTYSDTVPLDMCQA